MPGGKDFKEIRGHSTGNTCIESPRQNQYFGEWHRPRAKS